VAVSPIVGGATIKGPAAKMYRELGIEPSALAVAKHYQGWVTGFVLDQMDLNLEKSIEALGVEILVTDTIMTSIHQRRQLAIEVLEFCEKIV
jgi:LPPG:FO 2-phospho-L-lactate transferase